MRAQRKSNILLWGKPVSTLPGGGFSAATILCFFRELFVFIFNWLLVLVDSLLASKNIYSSAAAVMFWIMTRMFDVMKIKSNNRFLLQILEFCCRQPSHLLGLMTCDTLFIQRCVIMALPRHRCSNRHIMRHGLWARRKNKGVDGENGMQPMIMILLLLPPFFSHSLHHTWLKWLSHGFASWTEASTSWSPRASSLSLPPKSELLLTPV